MWTAVFGVRTPPVSFLFPFRNLQCIIFFYLYVDQKIKNKHFLSSSNELFKKRWKTRRIGLIERMAWGNKFADLFRHRTSSVITHAKSSSNQSNFSPIKILNIMSYAPIEIWRLIVPFVIAHFHISKCDLEIRKFTNFKHHKHHNSIE